MCLLKSIVELKGYPEVIQTNWSSNNQLVESLEERYILTDEIIDELYLPIIKKLYNDNIEETNSTLIVGPYGTGKSYFTLILNSLLEQMSDKRSFIWERFIKYNNNQYLDEVKNNNNGKILTIPINMLGKTQYNFYEIINENFIDRISDILPEVKVKSEFEKVLQSIRDMSINAKSDFEEEIKEHSMTLTELISKLKDKDKIALNIYYKSIENIIQNKVNKFDYNPIELINDMFGNLKSKGYEKIVFTFDEFGQYLLAWANEPRWVNITDQIQKFAEFTNSSQGEVTFIGIMHDSLEELFSSKQYQEIYNKLMGRFEEIYLNKINIIDLVQGQFRQKKMINNDFKEIKKEQISRLNSLSKEVYRIKDFWKSYPLSPQVLYYLPYISRGLAQENRTTFKFVNEMLNNYKNVNIFDDQGNLFLINLDHIFDYYLPNMKVKDPNVLSVYNRVLEYCDSELSKRIIKILLVFHIAAKHYSPKEQENTQSIAQSNIIETGATVERLQELLLVDNINMIKKACQPLLNSGFVHISPTNGQLAVLPGAGITYEEIMQKLREKRKFTNPEEYLYKLINRRIYYLDIFRKLAISYVVSRIIKGVIINYEDFLKWNNFDSTNNSDGQIIFIIPKPHNAFNYELKGKVKIKARELNKRNIAVAIIKQYPINIEMLASHEAYDLIKAQYLDNDQALQVIQRNESDILKTVEAELKLLCKASNFTLYYCNKEYNNILFDDFSKLMMDNLYLYFPLYGLNDKYRIAQNINGRNTTNKLLNTIVANKEMKFPSNSNREEHRQIIEFLEPMGLVKVEREENLFLKAILVLPNKSSNCYYAWQIIENNIFQSIANVYEILQAEPFGIPFYIIEILLAIFVRLGQADIFNKLAEKIEGPNQVVISDVSTRQDSKYQFHKKDKLSKGELDQLNNFSSIVNEISEKNVSIINYNDISIIDVKTNTQLKEHMNYLKDLLYQYNKNLKDVNIENGQLENKLKSLSEVKGKTIYEYSRLIIESIYEIIEITKDMNSNSREIEVGIFIKEVYESNKIFDEIKKHIRILDSGILKTADQDNYKDLFNEYYRTNKAYTTIMENKLLGDSNHIFINATKEFIEKYQQIYIFEHNQCDELVKKLNYEIKTNHKYLLLKELRQLFGANQATAKIEGLINIQLNECNAISSLNIDKDFYCIRCNYKLGLINSIIDEKRKIKLDIIHYIKEDCLDYIKLLYSKLYDKRNVKVIKSIINVIEKILFQTFDKDNTDEFVTIIKNNNSIIRDILEENIAKSNRYSKSKVMTSFNNYCGKEFNDNMTFEEIVSKIIEWIDVLKTM